MRRHCGNCYKHSCAFLPHSICKLHDKVEKFGNMYNQLMTEEKFEEHIETCVKEYQANERATRSKTLQVRQFHIQEYIVSSNIIEEKLERLAPIIWSENRQRGCTARERILMCRGSHLGRRCFCKMMRIGSLRRFVGIKKYAEPYKNGCLCFLCA